MSGRLSMKRRAGILRRIVAVGAAALLIVLIALPAGGTAFGATLEEKQAEARRLQGQIDALKSQGQQITSEYNAAVTQLEMIQASVEQNDEKLQEAEENYLFALRTLNDRMRAMYKSQDVNGIEVILESQDIDDFLTRVDYMAMIGRRDASVLSEVKALQKEIADTQAALEQQQSMQNSVVVTIRDKQAALQQSLASQQALLSSTNAEIVQIMDQMNRNRNTGGGGGSGGGGGGSGGGGGGGGGGVVVGNFVFPVRGPHSFSNDWHAPRTGHLHQGTDIFAAMGTPTGACVSGTVEWGEGGNAGIYIRLDGDDGNVYYYMHLQRYGQGGHVSAGTIIGYVGDTGNAAGGPPHLHFEIHPGGGSAVNPYPTLSAADY